MSALEQWLTELLLGHSVNMLRVEAEVKARVLALMILMQKDLVSILANAPEMSMLGKAGKNALLRESNVVIAEYYGKAQLQVDLFGIADVEARGVQRALAAVIDRAAGQAGAEVRLGIGLPTENYLRKLASDTIIQGGPAKAWWARQEQDTAFKLASQIRIGAAQGETNAQIIKRIVGTEVTAKAVPEGEALLPGIMPLARKNAAAIVQASMQTVAGEARRATFQFNRDITNGLMQVSTLDGHTSLTCIAYSGACWDLDYEPINGNDLPYLSGVPRHWNCLLGDALVLPRSEITGVSKRWFDGEIIVIRTAGGRELTSTPNHPILTSRGWVSSSLIDVGGDVVCDGGSEWRRVGDGDHQNVPTRIEDEFSAFFAARQVLPVPVPLTAKDFHGDGGGSKVAIVWTESFLRNGDDASVKKHCGQGVLVGGSPLIAAHLTSCGCQRQSFEAGRDAATSIVGGACECGALGQCGARHSGELLLASVAGFNAVAAQDFADDANRHPELVEDAARADTGLEEIDHISLGRASGGQITHNSAIELGSDFGYSSLSENGCNDFVVNAVFDRKFAGCGASVVACDNGGCRQGCADLSAQGDATFGKDVEDSLGADAKLARNIIDGHSGVVFLDDVVSVSVRQFSGHVYNLETVGGWYSANGIVTHNCRSGEISIMKTLREMGIDMDEPDPGMRASSNGPISAKTTFADYLTMKGADYQNEVLGPGRAELFRVGKLSPRDLVDMRGRPLKLEQLRERYGAVH